MKKERRKIVKIFSIVCIILIGAALTLIISNEFDKAVVTKFVKNEILPVIKADWQGNPVDEKGRFVNEEFPYLP